MIPNFTKPVALFGGSFDPIHEGHLHVAREVGRAIPELSIVFVPAFQSPGKAQPTAPAELRLQWLQITAKTEGHGVWETELERKGTSYTVETLEEAHRLGAKRDHLYLVLGADAYASLDRWKDPERIRSLCRILVVSRPGTQLATSGADDIVLSPPPHSASSTAIRAGLAANPPMAEFLPKEVKSALESLILLNKNPYARKTD